MEINKVVIFQLNKEEFAININQVERILGYIEPTSIPESPVYIKGVIQYQDTILPIMDLKIRFNKLDMNSYVNPKIIVVKNNEQSIGLIVDDVEEVLDINAHEIESTPDIVKLNKNKYINGIIKKDNRIIMLLDAEKILSKEEMDMIQSIY
ncbi:MAG: chemotaxis protein CheW [Clostridiales bacterium]|nr:chemotaxis protein CheW [Clostridiales bacterium]